MLVAVTILRREGVKLTPAEIEAACPIIGYLHFRGQGPGGAHVGLTAGKQGSATYLLPSLHGASIESIKPGGRMLIYGIETLSFPRQSEAFPQAWACVAAAPI